jgi:hypothetical protein
VGGLGGRDDGRVGDEREVDTRVGDQVGLELVQIDVERAIETERRGNRRDDWVIVSFPIAAHIIRGKSGSYPEQSGG